MKAFSASHTSHRFVPCTETNQLFTEPAAISITDHGLTDVALKRSVLIFSRLNLLSVTTEAGC